MSEAGRVFLRGMSSDLYREDAWTPGREVVGTARR